MTENTEAAKADGYIFVSRIAYGEEEVDTTNLKVPDFQGVPVARVTVGASYTKNLGNYESAKINIEVSLPCFPVEEEIARAYDVSQVLMGEMLAEQLGALEK